MQAKCAFLITLGAALAAGSSMMTSAHAQSNVPYYEVDEITVKDQAGYEGSGVGKIREAADAIGCHIVAGGYNKAVGLIGDPPQNRFLIVRCPDKEAGDKRWDMVTKWLDEGKKYATFRAIAVDGTEAAFVPGAYFQVVEINVKDQKGYEGSGVASVRDSMKAEGGTVIGGGYNKAHSLIGDAPANRYLIIQYPSKAANDKHFTASVKPWWEGEGRKYSDFRAVGVEGVASTTAQTDAGGVKAASQAFYAALNARDSNAMAKVYAHTPYVVHISPVAKEIDTGWDAVNKGWEETFQKMTSKIDVSFNAAGAPQIDGDMAWEVGTEKGSLTFADGKTVPFAAFATNVFQKIGGHWQLVAHQAGLLPK